MNTDKILKKGTVACPKCNERLHFEQIQGMRIVKDGYFSAYCPKDKSYYLVIA